MTCCEPVLGLFARCRHMIEGHPDCLVVDLRGVGKADTKLAACLVALYKVAEASSVKLELQTSEAIQDVLTLYRLQGLIDRTRPGAL